MFITLNKTTLTQLDTYHFSGILYYTFKPGGVNWNSTKQYGSPSKWSPTHIYKFAIPCYTMSKLGKLFYEIN